MQTTPTPAFTWGSRSRSATSRRRDLPPVLRDFSSQVSFLIRDGQTAQLTVGTDPVSGDVVEVDVTLNVVQ